VKADNELYRLAERHPCRTIEPCPICGADAELWEYSDDFENAAVTKVVMCTNADRIGPQVGGLNDGCMLYMPPEEFYHPRIVAAVDYWNSYAVAIGIQRRKRNWDRSSALRDGSAQ
jgi:hypothetical protein